MALIYNFPSDKQRKRAGIESVIHNALNSTDGLSGENKSKIMQMIMAAFDQYFANDMQVSISISPPNDQPFTDGQVVAIQSALLDLQKQYEAHISSVFLDILTLKVELFKLTEC